MKRPKWPGRPQGVARTPQHAPAGSGTPGFHERGLAYPGFTGHQDDTPWRAVKQRLEELPALEQFHGPMIARLQGVSLVLAALSVQPGLDAPREGGHRE